MTVFAIPTTAGVLTNSAQVSAGTLTQTDPDPNRGNNIATVTSQVLAPSGTDLAIDQLSDSPDPVGPGGTLTYTIRVANNGAAPASGGLLRVELPAGVVF